MTEVVAALILGKNENNETTITVFQRPAHKARGLLYEFVGGKVEPQESGKEALVRECREELGVTMDVGEVYMDVVHEYPDITVHLTIYYASVASGSIRLLEHNDMKTITPSQIDTLQFCPADKEILEKIKRDFA